MIESRAGQDRTSQKSVGKRLEHSPQQRLQYPNHVVTPTSSAYTRAWSAVSCGPRQAQADPAVCLHPVPWGRRETQQEKWGRPDTMDEETELQKV